MGLIFNRPRPEIILAGRLVEAPGLRVVQKPLPAGYASPRQGKDYDRIILHHDACLSAASCFKVLIKRGVSTHFIIDNDGTIWQVLDPLRFRAWSAGRWDAGAAAIDFSNACELAYAKHYKPPRPVLTQIIHGAGVRWTGLYPAQVDACANLVRLLCARMDIPAEVPLYPDGTAKLELLDPVPDGVIGHLHCSRGKDGRPNKADPFGLDWPMFQRLIRPARA